MADSTLLESSAAGQVDSPGRPPAEAKRHRSMGKRRNCKRRHPGPKPTRKTRGVFERPVGSGTWWVRYADETGRIHRQCVGMKSTATSVYQQKKTEVREGRFQPPSIKRCSCTVNELLDDYLESCKARQIRDLRTLSGRLRIWREAIGKKSARMVSVGDIESALLKYANGKPLGPNHTRRAEKRAPATVKRALIALKSCFKYAQRNGKLDRNPASEIKPPKENNQRVRFLTPEEEARLWSVMPAEYHPMAQLAIQTGLRKMELFKLNWTDLNFQQRMIAVRDSKTGQGRNVPMNDLACEVLKGIIRRVDNPYLFPGEKPGSHRTDLPLHWEDYLEEARIEDFRWHDLRHTTASRLAMSGVDLYTIAKILGHSDMSMTVRYAHLAPGFLQEAMKKLAGYVQSKTDTKTGTNEE